MSKRKLTKHYSSNEYYLNKRIKVSKVQEDAYWENIKNERQGRFVNDYYQENKYRFIPALIIITMVSYPFIKIGEVYQYCKKKVCKNKVEAEINDS